MKVIYLTPSVVNMLESARDSFKREICEVDSELVGNPLQGNSLKIVEEGIWDLRERIYLIEGILKDYNDGKI